MYPEYWYLVYSSVLTNGDLLAIAEQNGYELMITTDQNLRYQQNLASRQIAIVVLLSTSWPGIQSYIEMIRDAVNKSFPGTSQEIVITR
jgi:hypothetical protein